MQRQHRLLTLIIGRQQKRGISGRARAQLEDGHSDAVVANGPAHGPGFTWLTRTSEHRVPDVRALNRILEQALPDRTQ